MGSSALLLLLPSNDEVFVSRQRSGADGVPQLPRLDLLFSLLLLSWHDAIR